MTDRLIDKYAKEAARRTRVNASDTDSDEVEDRGCFGWLRGIRDRAIMLELRKKDGHVMAVGYAWLERVEFEPDAGITLHLPDRKIRIHGTGLNSEARSPLKLLDGIIRHRVPWLREATKPELLKPGANAVLIESIDWGP